MFAPIPNDLGWSEDPLPVPLTALMGESAAFWRWRSQMTLAQRAKQEA